MASGALRWENAWQVDASNHKHSLWTITLFAKAKHVGRFSFRQRFFRRGPSVQGIPLWRARRSRTLTFSFWFPLILWIVFPFTLVSSRELTFCCALYAIPTVYFSFAVRRALQRQRKLVKLSFVRRAMLLTRFLLQVSDLPSF